MVSHWARARAVPASARRRSDCISTYAIDDRCSRIWLECIFRVDTRSANIISFCSLMRFSISPLAQYSPSYSSRASASPLGSEVTTKRGFGPSRVYSALPTTRRARLQLLSVRYWKSRNRRDAPAVRASAPSPASACCLAFIRIAMERRRDLCQQPLVASQAEQVVDAVALAPGHDPFAAEAAVATHHDPGLRPGGAQLRDDPLRRLIEALDEQRDEKVVHGGDVGGDAVVAVMVRSRGAAILEPVQGALAGQRDAAVARPSARRAVQVLAPAGQGQQPVVAQLVVIVDILVAERQSEHPLADQGLEAVLDHGLVAAVIETAGEPLHDAEPLLEVAQENGAAVGAQGSTIEPGLDAAAEMGLKRDLSGDAVCRHEAVVLSAAR